jgi:phosphoglycerate dehydrogenase-like enzyme
MDTEDGWVGLGAIGRRLANIASDFDPRTYGFRKLSDLVRGTGAFEIDQPEGRAMRIRAKATAPGRTRTRSPSSRR